jgi:gluconokinase
MNVNAPGVRSPHDQVGGIVYFGRMLDKIRLQAKGQLHEELQANLGKGFDERILQFLRVDYDKLKEVVLGGASDLQALEWCFQEGRRPDEIDIEVWNEFMRKRGWNDSGSPMLKKRLLEGGFTDRTDILTMFDFIDLDEGRDPALRKRD